MICYYTYYNCLLLHSCNMYMLWSCQPSINDIVTSFTRSIAMSVNYCMTTNICDCCDTVCMYALWNPHINNLMNNYLNLKHYTCTCSATAYMNTKLVMKVIIDIFYYYKISGTKHRQLKSIIVLLMRTSSQQVTITYYKCYHIFIYCLILLCSCIIASSTYARVVNYCSIYYIAFQLLYQNVKLSWYKNYIKRFTNLSCIEQLLRSRVSIYWSYCYRIKSKHVSLCKYVGNNLIVAMRYEQLFLEYHLRLLCRLTEIIIYLVLLSMLILWKLVKICFMFAHRWISISPAQWLI